MSTNSALYVYVLPQSLYLCLQYHVILNCIIIALNCTRHLYLFPTFVQIMLYSTLCYSVQCYNKTHLNLQSSLQITKANVLLFPIHSNVAKIQIETSSRFNQRQQSGAIGINYVKWGCPCFVWNGSEKPVMFLCWKEMWNVKKIILYP